MFEKQNNNVARASRFFLHFFAVLHDYDVQMPNFVFYRERIQATTYFISLFEIEYGPLEFKFRRVSVHLTK